MNFQLLLSTLNKDPQLIIEQSNINSDAIIINQCNKNDYEEFTHKGHTIKVWYTKERGIGKSRNMALEKATADVVLFADDDEVFESNYEKTILNTFSKNKKMDFAVFDIKSFGDKRRKRRPIAKFKKLHSRDALRYGAVRFAVRRKKILKHNIKFSLEFGGGCKYSRGEDNIFLHDCIKSKLKVFSIPKIIATVDDSHSSWFNGKNEKYYYDTGALYGALFPAWTLPLKLLYFIRYFIYLKKDKRKKFFTSFCKGVNQYKKNKISNNLTQYFHK